MAIVGRLIVQIAADISALRKDMQKAADEIRRSFDGIRNAALSLAGVVGVAFSVDAMKDFLMTSALAESRLNALRKTMQAVAGDAKYGDALLDWVRQMANDLALPIDGVIELTKQIVAATATSKELRGEGTERIIKATLEVAAGMQLSAAATEQFGRALYQILGRGKVMTEELNQLADALPQGQQRLAEVAQQFGFIDKNSTNAVGALREFLAAGGELPAGILVPLLEGVSKSFGKLNRLSLTGFEREIIRLSTAWNDFKIAFSKSSGLDQILSGVSIVFEQWARGLEKGLQDPNNAFAQLSKTINELGKQFLAWLQSIDNAKIESWIKSTRDWIDSFKGLASSINDVIEKFDGLKQSAEDFFSLDPSKWFRKTTSADFFSMKGGLITVLDKLTLGGDWVKTVKKDFERMGFTATPTVTVKPIIKLEDTDFAKRFEAMKGLTAPATTVKVPVKIDPLIDSQSFGTWREKLAAMKMDVQQALISASEATQMPLNILVGIAYTESFGGKQFDSLGNLIKNSKTGAAGLMQVIPANVIKFKIDPANIEQNAMTGAKILKEALARRGGNMDKALADYGGFKTKDPTNYLNKIYSIAGATEYYTKQATAAASATQGFGRKLGEATKSYDEMMTKTATSFADWTSALAAQKIEIPTEILDKIGLMKEGYESLYKAQKQSADLGNESLKAQLDAAESLKAIGTDYVDYANRRVKLQADIAAGSATAAEQDRNLAAAQAQLAVNAQQVIDKYIAERDAASGMSQVNEILADRRAEIQQTVTAAGQQYAVEVMLTKAQEAEAAGNTALAETYRKRVIEMEAAAEAAQVEAELLATVTKLRKELAAAGKGTDIDWDAVTQQIKGVAQAAGEAKAQQLVYSQSLDKMSKDTQTLADDMLDIAKSAASSMESAFSDFFFSIMQGDMEDLADKFKETLDRMVADMMARQLGDYLFGDFAKTGQGGGLFGGLIEWFKGKGSGASIFETLFGSSSKTGTSSLNLGGTEDISKQATSWFDSVKSIFSGGFGSFFGWLGSTVTSLFSGLSSTLSGLLSSVTGLFSGAGGGSSLFGSIGSIFSSLFGGIGSFFSGLFGFHQGGPAQAVAANVIPFPRRFHTGGPVSPVRATAEVLPFPKLHAGGGAPGLKSDELVAILQKRELVLTESQQRAVRGMIDPAKAVTADQRKVLEWLPKFHNGGITTDELQLMSNPDWFVKGNSSTAKTGYVIPIGLGTLGENYTPTATKQWGDGTGGSSTVIVNISTPDANSFRRSESQIAAQMSRAISTASRRNH